MTRAQASGQGDVQTNTDPTKGVACFPPLGCGSDWNVCSTVDDLSATPMGQLHDADAVRAACEEITALAKGGESYSQPPAGGWQPSSLGWLKGTGNVGCGWGSTYWSISPDAPYTTAVPQTGGLPDLSCNVQRPQLVFHADGSPRAIVNGAQCDATGSQQFTMIRNIVP